MVSSKKANLIFTVLVCFVVLVLSTTIILQHLLQVNTSLAADLNLPAPNQIIKASNNYHAPVLRGLKIDKNNPYKIEFLLEEGNSRAVSKQEQEELVKYFLSALTVKNEDLWVNLSPYESDRILASNTQKLDIGAELLKQDYILKQFTSSLTDPNSELGIKFWKQNTASNSFNKVWIVPDTVELYQKDNVAYINRASLDIKSEQDYLALKINAESGICSVNEDIIKAIKSEVNNGKHFAKLRQIYNSIILAQWFKANIRNKLSKNYVDQNKLKGIESGDKQIKDKVFNLYTKSFKDGVYKINTKSEGVKRQYLSGGVDLKRIKQSSAVSPVESENDMRSLGVEVTEMKENFDLEVKVKKADVIYMTAEEIHTWMFEILSASSFKQIGMLADLKKIDFSEHQELLEKFILYSLYPLANQVSGMVKDLSMEAMAELSVYMSPEVVNNQVIPFLVKKGNIQTLRILERVNQGDLEGKVGAFLSLLLEEVDSHTEITEEDLSESLKEYFSVYDQIDDDFIADLLEVYKLTEIIHYQIATSLKALSNVGLRVQNVASIRKHLSYGTPINSIITILGNDKKDGGFAELTRTIVEGDKFDKLMEAVIYFVDQQRAGAVQTVYGFFTMLDRKRKEEDLLAWNDFEWLKNVSQVRQYYEAGFPIMTDKLFQNYIERASDQEALNEFVSDVKNVLGGDTAFGGFKGFSKEFMDKYNLTVLDELALLGYWVPFVNHPIQFYEKLYIAIKESLDDEYLNGLDAKYKKRFSFEYGKQANTSYLGTENSYVGLVVSLIDVFKAKMDLHDLADESNKKLAFITSMLLKVVSREEKVSLLGRQPEGPKDVYAYLNKVLRFYTEILDKHSTDLFWRIDEEFKMHPKAVAQIMDGQIRKEFESVEGKDSFYKPGSDIAKALKKLKNIDKKSDVIENVAKIIKEHYLLKRITQEDLLDKEKLLNWLYRFQESYSLWMAKKIKFDDAQLIEEVIEESFIRAVDSLSDKILSDDERKINGYKFKLYSEIAAVVKQIKKTLQGFKVTKEIEAEQYFTGLYRGLPHQVEFGQTGSCMRNERPTRIKNRKLHAVIPVQDSNGKFQGSGRLQIMEQGFSDPALEEMRGERKLISLFGISLGHKGGLTIDAATAFNAIVETAKTYADENGYVLIIPDHFDVQSNYESERAMIRDLHYKHNKSVKAKLANPEVLSLSTYKYEDVYVVTDVNRVLNDSLNPKESSSVSKVDGGIDFKSLVSSEEVNTSQISYTDPNILGYSFEIILNQPLEIFSDFFTSQNI